MEAVVKKPSSPRCPDHFMKRICLETTAISLAFLNALGPALNDIIDPHLRVDQTKFHFGRTGSQTEIATPIQIAQSREAALFAKLVEISVRSLGALGLWTHWFNGNGSQEQRKVKVGMVGRWAWGRHR